TIADMYDTKGQVSKLKNELANMEIRNEQYVIRAPQDGFVMRALKAGIGQTIKEGEAVASIMPINPDLAVELFVQAMDIPLLYEGAPVRIEFDGWPALVFSGWPGLNVGTFGGEVAMIDYANDMNGLYRILVVPKEEEWPEQLRQGSGAYGWVMLSEVPVWWEIWRQLNGFPPDLVEEKNEVKKAK
ncbi:MAG: HlyD family efflux transporter periplasmic adaptor subunit, partial [Cyclobacteriaceae bacterium]